MSRGTNLEYARGYNRRIVLETVRRYGPVSRMELANRTSLAVQTIANIVNELLERDLIMTGERRQGKRGSPSVDLLINPHGAYAIGVNFDRDRVTGALLDLSGTVHAEAEIELAAPTPEHVLPLFSRIVSEFLPKVDRSKLLGVAIGVPGPLHVEERDGLLPQDLLAWGGVDIGERIEDTFGLATFIERNANAAAIGEYWYGVGRDYASFFHVYMGMGLGSAIIGNGSLHQDKTRHAGKIGYVPLLIADGDSPPRQLRGAFSFAALKEHLDLHGLHAHDPDSLKAFFTRRDRALMSWLDAAAEALAPILYTVECILAPPAIVFGGRLPPLLMQHVLDRVEELLAALRTPEQHPIRARLLCAEASANVAALGVATVPLYELLAPDHSLLLKEDGPAEREHEILQL